LSINPQFYSSTEAQSFCETIASTKRQPIKKAHGETVMLRTFLRLSQIFAAFFLTIPAQAGAPAVAVDLHHEAVDEARYPWSAVGKLFNEAGGECSGAVISDHEILTAAHCLFNFRRQRFVSPDALHFFIGYRTGRYAAQARIIHYRLGSGFDPLRYGQTAGEDWAILTTA